MCTAISYTPLNHYFGRNLDLEYSYGESVIITPRRFLLDSCHENPLSSHPAMIGIGIIAGNYPLYFDAVNEHGLCAAGLNFPGNAKYRKATGGMHNIASYELIPWLLSKCENLCQAKSLLAHTNITDTPHSADYPVSPLHWFIADRTGCITLESTCEGIQVYDNPIGVLTNNPPFDYHMHNLNNFMTLTAAAPENRFSKNLRLTPYSRGMGGMGLPGDLSSASRFVRAAFTMHNAVAGDTDDHNITQFFHILESVSQTEGCAAVGDGYEKTVYSSCCNTSTGIYYYTTYNNRQITGVNMHAEDLNSSMLMHYPLLCKQSINMIN